MRERRARDARREAAEGCDAGALRVRCSKIDSRARSRRAREGDAMGDSTHAWGY